MDQRPLVSAGTAAVALVGSSGADAVASCTQP
jgi:hypothetical protein